MRVPLDEANVSLGLHTLGQAGAGARGDGGAPPAPPLLSALHPNRALLALARGPVLSFLPVAPGGGECGHGGGGGPGGGAGGGDADGPDAGPDVAPASPRLRRHRGGRGRAGGAGAAAGGAGTAAGAAASGSPSAARGGGGGGGGLPAFYTLRSSQDITSLAWLCVLTGSRQLGAASLTVRPPDLGDLLECDALLVGMADGTLQIHEPGGKLLFRQRLHTGPVEHIAVRPCSAGAWRERGAGERAVGAGALPGLALALQRARAACSCRGCSLPAWQRQLSRAAAAAGAPTAPLPPQACASTTPARTLPLPSRTRSCGCRCWSCART
jgi:hypothetical protein